MFGREREDKINLANYTVTTIIGSDTVVEGTIITKSSVRIDGTLVGGVSAEGVVILTKQGKIHGNVMAENIIVAGVVEGNMQIRDKVDVEPTGEIYGDITTKKLLIDEESIFQGNCYMNRDKQAEIAKRKEQADQIRFGEENAEGETDEKKNEKKSLFEKAVAAGKKEVGKNIAKAAKVQTAATISKEAEPSNNGAEEKSSSADEDAENADSKNSPDQTDVSVAEQKETETASAEAAKEPGKEEDEDINFLDVNAQKNGNSTNDNKRRKS